MQSDSRNSHPNLEVIEVNGKQLVSGLFWRPLRSVRSYMAEAKEIGKKEGMEMVTIRKGRTVIQAGFAPKGRQGLKGLYSLAAALAGQLGENWIGCFEVGPDRYVLVAVTKGAVAPGFDLVGPRDLIEERLRQVYSVLTSNPQDEFTGRIIAPREFEFGDEAIDLAELLPAKAVRKEHRLRPLTLGLTPRQIGGVGIGAAVLLGAAYGVSWWLERQEQEREREAAIAAARAQLQQAAAQKAGIVLPWTTLPAPHALLDACATVLDSTPLSVAGWVFTESRCTPDQATVSYRRQSGAPVGTFAAAAQAQFGQSPALFEQGTVGVVQQQVALQPKTDDRLRGTSALLMDVTDYMQSVGPIAVLTIADRPFVPDPEDPEALPPEWSTSDFAIQTKLPPELLFAGVDANGVRVLEVVASLNAEEAEINWIINGELYGR